MASPLLLIRRIVVTGDLTLDLALDRGLNVLYAAPGHGDPRLTNKAGKTALVELIQYGLGRRQRNRETFHFAPVIDQLGTLYLEVEINGTVLTIERSLQDIFAGAVVREMPYLADISALPGDKVDLETLSAKLLGYLGIPEVAIKTRDGDLSPLTFPNLMRAFVLHQNDSFGSILDKVQPESRKTDILGLLTGIIPARAYQFEEQLAKIQQRQQTVTHSLEAVRTYLRDHNVPSFEEAERRLQIAQSAATAAEAAQREAQLQLRAMGRVDLGGEGHIGRLRASLLETQTQRADLARDLTGLRGEEQRLRELVRSLQADEQRVERLQTATAVLSTVDFDRCPRCLQELTEDMRQREAYARCGLCNRTLDITSDEMPRFTPSVDDIATQLEEAQGLLRDVQTEREAREQEYQNISEVERRAARQLDEATAAYVAPSLDRLGALAHDVARQQRDLDEAAASMRHVLALRDMEQEIAELQLRQVEVENEREEARRHARGRLRRLTSYYRDALRKVAFPALRSVRIGRSLMPYINGSLYIHTGTALTGVATVCYHLALLRLSLEVTSYFPRLLVIDSPAVGDLNEDNHRLLLDYLAGLSDGDWGPSDEEVPENRSLGDEPVVPEPTTGIEWQIILTTRRMTPRLEPFKVMEISSEPGRMLLRPPRRSARQSGTT